MPTPPASGYTHPCSASALAAGSTPYSRASGIDYLAEYATRYNTVEVDQWFWAMPEPATAAQYASVTPADFRFTVKLPNTLTLTRIVLVPLVVWLIITHEMAAAFVLFLLAGLSDAADGYLAKRFGWHTELGAYLDPIADKALLVSIYLMLGFTNHLPVLCVPRTSSALIS